MKKPSKQVRSNVLNALLIVGTILIVLYLGAKNGDISASLAAILQCDKKWLLIALGSWIGSLACEGIINYVFFRQQHVKAGFWSTMHIAVLGVFYSNITPASTGGQPMQVFAFRKRGIAPGVASSSLTVKFFCFQVAMLTLGGGLWISHAGFVASCAEGAKWMILFGFLLNGASVGLVLLLAINKNIVRFLIFLILKAGEKLHIVKDIASTSSKIDATLNEFHASVDMITHHPLQLLVLLLFSYLQVIGLMSVSYCTCRALGVVGLDYTQAMTLQLLLFLAASFMPLPGASGAQEGGYALLYAKVVPGDLLFASLLLWRFVTYYFPILVGLCSTIYESAYSIRRNSQKGQAEQQELSGKE